MRIQPLGNPSGASSQIWRLATRIIEAGTDVILEIGLLQRRERERLYKRVSARGYDLTIHVLDAPRDLRRERVQQRNHERGATFSMVVPEHIFELASDMWEPLEEDECSGRDVHFMFTDWSTGEVPAGDSPG